MNGLIATIAIGMRSVAGSYGSALCKVALIAIGVDVACSSV